LAVSFIGGGNWRAEIKKAKRSIDDELMLLKSRVIQNNHNSSFTWFYSKVVISNPAHGEVYSIQHYVIKFVSDLQQVGGFLKINKKLA
jgi:hypothetical protein